jgi:hypothetical protein
VFALSLSTQIGSIILLIFSMSLYFGDPFLWNLRQLSRWHIAEQVILLPDFPLGLNETPQTVH